jgi:hypothetical protein
MGMHGAWQICGSVTHFYSQVVDIALLRGGAEFWGRPPCFVRSLRKVSGIAKHFISQSSHGPPFAKCKHSGILQEGYPPGGKAGILQQTMQIAITTLRCFILKRFFLLQETYHKLTRYITMT